MRGIDNASFIVVLSPCSQVLSLPDRAVYWTSLAANVTKEMDEWMWDEATGAAAHCGEDSSNTPF
jgi:hypothetical protein